MHHAPGSSLTNACLNWSYCGKCTVTHILSVSARESCCGGWDSAPCKFSAESDRKWGVRCEGGEQKRAGWGDGDGMRVEEDMRDLRSSRMLRTLALSLLPDPFSLSAPFSLSPFSLSPFSPFSFSPRRTISAIREVDGVEERGGGGRGRVWGVSSEWNWQYAAWHLIISMMSSLRKEWSSAEEESLELRKRVMDYFFGWISKGRDISIWWS